MGIPESIKYPIDAKTLSYVDPAGVERSIPVEKVACVFTRPLLPEVRGKALAGRPRICLANGDVMEAEVKGLSARKVAAVSVVFGPQNLDLARIAIVVLRPMAPAGPISVYTRDGSVHQCTAVRVSEGTATAEGPLMGTIDLKAADIVAITNEAASRT